MKEFIHLHNHSHYSLLDAICTIDDLVNAAAENNMSAVALTDHGVMNGAMEFYLKCRKKNIKPVIGFEAYVAQGSSRFDKGRKIETAGSTADIIVDAENSDGLSVANINYAHLILLAKNETGYKNLVKLNSIGHTEGFYYKPRIDLEVLNRYKEGIVALSACAGGVISCYIVRDDLQMARKMTGAYKDIFGEDFYLEIQNHITLDSEKKVLRMMPKLAKEFGLKLIATNDVHYIRKEHAIAHNIYLHISSKQNRVIETDLTTQLRYGTDQIYFKSVAEMCKLFEDFPEAIKSTLEVAEKCNLELDTKTNHMPNFPIPADSKANNLDEYLKELSYEGLKKRVKEITPETKKRLDYELEVIKGMKYSGYFLIVADFINTAKSRGILVGPGRGSAAGSLVCYCLGITNVNPLEYNLLFERFLNPDRISMPDIDIDFQDDRRDEVIQYAKEKYGENSVAQIITFNKLAPRGVLKDVGRVLQFSFDEINNLTKLIPIKFGKVKPLSECWEEVPEFKNFFEKGTAAEKTEKKNLFEYSRVLENLNKNASIHASGIVIAPSDITDYVPLARAKKDPDKKNGDNDEENAYCTQFDMNRLEDAGLIKMDFLGLKELKIIGRTLELVNRHYKTNLTIDSIPLDDRKTYELFSAGLTIGIFQFSKSKMREYLSKLKPQNINDLAAMNALYRPGPMDVIPDFIDKRYGRKPITYLHPLMENSLKDTYGIIVYQEQVMQIAREVAGFSMSEADIMRKAMGKKIKEKMAEEKTKFIEGAVRNGVSKKTATEIFALIQKFADYGFNKSHGVAYSILAFYTAYLKAHYPLEFLAVSMEGRKDDETELQLLADEASRMGIKLRQPDVNESYLNFRVKHDGNSEKGEIIYGLSAIKNVGEKAAENIASERDKNGPYRSFTDFLIRVDLRLVNKKTVESLIYAGAFDSLEKNRRKLFCNIERATMFASKIKETPEQQGQHGIFSDTPHHHGITELKLEETDDFPEIEKYNLEKQMVGFYLSGHPLEKYRKNIENLINLSFSDDINEVEPSVLANAKMCGVINNFEEKISKKGNKFGVFTLVDFYGRGDCVAFGTVLDDKRNCFKNDNLVYVEGKAEESADKIKLIVQNILPIDELPKFRAENLNIEFPKEGVSREKLIAIRELADKFQGKTKIYFTIRDNGKAKTYFARDIKVSLTEELISNLKKIVGEHNLHIN